MRFTLSHSKIMKIKRKLLISIPMMWFCIFLFIPFLFVLGISFTTPENGIPPVSSIINLSKQSIHIVLHLNNYINIMHYKIVFVAIFESLKVAFITTFFCILIGYPMALALARFNKKAQRIFLMVIIIPYWTSFLLRSYAWVTLLGNHTLNVYLMKLGLPNMALLYNKFSMYLGMVYCYLPFFILPLYSSLIKLDQKLNDAAADLGAKPLKIFLSITLPLSKPGLIAGGLLVFIPAVGEIVVPQIMGGMNSLMIGNIIWQEFFTANDWGAAATISILLLFILVLPIIWMQKIQQNRQYF